MVLLSVLMGLSLLISGGCSRPVPTGSLVVTQAQRLPPAPAPRDTLELRYPAGSRVALAEPPYEPQDIRVLSQGLWAAGEPVVADDGSSDFFAGKSASSSDWQIYQARLPGGRPRAVTSMPGGAMEPSLLPNASLVFASPVPKLSGSNSNFCPSVLYAQAPGEKPRRLTFCPGSAADPTVLSDGRILFVYTPPPGVPNSAPAGLYTINHDGTEITPMAGQHDQPSVLARPRESPDGRIVFLAASPSSKQPGGRAEFVRLARPFQSRAALFANAATLVRAIEPVATGDMLICAENPARASSPGGPLAVFRVDAAARSLNAPVFEDPAWDSCEAVQVAVRPPPMGRISTMDPASETGLILCLNVNYTTYGAPVGQPAVAPATRLRVLAERAPGDQCALGEVPVQADGSFMAEVPANVPLGFEALDEHGAILRRLAPMVWVRPGENRVCIGCHEPHNHSPHNVRPLAVYAPEQHLKLPSAKLAQTRR